MHCYISPSVYPRFSIDANFLESKILTYCNQNRYSVHSSTRQYVLKGWSIATGDDYLELALAVDAASIEITSSSQSLLCEFSFLVWINHPATANIHLIAGDLSKSYALQGNTTLEQISAFLL